MAYSMQDVIEELIGTEIVDETDQFVDNLRQQKVCGDFFSECSDLRVRSKFCKVGCCSCR